MEAAGEPLDGSPNDENLAPMAIAVETVSANAMTLVILALLASGLAIAGIDRSKRQTAPNAEEDVDTAPPSDK
jgi:hypothetical protein